MARHSGRSGVTALRVMIADDERPARLYIRGLLQPYDDVQIVGEAANGTEAVALIEQTAPDLALLDLQMPELDGLEVVQMLRRERVPLVAFVTAYDTHAVSAFEINAVDYLLKPVDATRLRRTITRAREALEQKDFRTTELDRITAATAEIDRSFGEAPRTVLRLIPVRRRDEVIFLSPRDIASVVAEGEMLWLTTHASERHQITYRLKDLEARLDDEQFIRLSRGALVNLDAIARVSPMPSGTFVVVLKNKQQLTVSRSRSRILRDTLLKL